MEHEIKGEYVNVKVLFDMDDTEQTQIIDDGKVITLTERQAVELANLIMNNYYGI